MKIKILKGEYLFSENGTHICDNLGFAKIADEDVECEINEEHFDRVQDLITSDRLFRGLDAEGNKIPEPQPEEPQS
jgi:hypothetical protein